MPSSRSVTTQLASSVLAYHVRIVPAPNFLVTVRSDQNIFLFTPIFGVKRNMSDLSDDWAELKAEASKSVAPLQQDDSILNDWMDLRQQPVYLYYIIQGMRQKSLSA